MSYQQILRGDRRLCLLQALAEDPSYSHNEHVLQSLLGSLGHHLSYDALRTELAWLAEQGLVTLTESAGLQVVKLTNRGEDAALGHVQIPGVARPRPEA